MRCNYYIYRHVKLTTSEVFYIGMGCQKDFSRAYTTHGRNIFWERLTNKHEYSVEILSTNLSKETACEIEQLLISWYGRRNLNEGTLVNLTDGGDGGKGYIKTKEEIEKWKISNKGKQDGALNVMYGRVGGLHHLSKEVINIENGIFYDSAIEAHEPLSMSYSGFKSKLNGNNFNDTCFMYVDDLEDKNFPIKKDNNRWKKVINIYTLEIFNSIVDASSYSNICPQNLGAALNGKISNKTGYLLLGDYHSGKKAEEKRGSKKYVIDTQTGVFYDSLKEASINTGIKYSILKNWLNPNISNKNKSSLIYA